MSRIKAITAVFLAITTLVFMAACGGSSQPASGSESPSAEKLKVAFVYYGSIGDYGWTYSQELGRKYLEEQMPGVDASKYVEGVELATDAERIFTQLAQEGFKVIVGTSYDYMDTELAVAEKFPDVVFLHSTGWKVADNMGTYNVRDYEVRYLCGVAAARYSKTKMLGFVAPFSTPDVVRNINAFLLGAQSVDPSFTCKVVYTNSWDDPATEKTAAEGLIAAGADVLATHCDSPSVAKAAQDKGVYAVSFYTDMSKYAPESLLTGGICNWGPYFVKTVKEVQAGTWKNDQYWGGMNENAVELAPFGAMVSDDVKNEIEGLKQQIIGGSLFVFSGPIAGQDGAEVVAAGAKMSDDDMLGFDWYIKGVEGQMQS